MIDPIEIIDQFYKDEVALRDILLRHSNAVRERALRCAARHPELNVDTQFVSEAAMLHDIGIIQTDAPGIECHGIHSYVEHGYLGAQMLRAIGLTRHALVCERHTGTGLTEATIVAQNINIPVRDMRPVSIEEQLICYADKFYSKSRLDDEDSVERVLQKFARHPEHQNDIEKFLYWKQLFE